MHHLDEKVYYVDLCKLKRLRSCNGNEMTSIVFSTARVPLITGVCSCVTRDVAITPSP